MSCNLVPFHPLYLFFIVVDTFWSCARLLLFFPLWFALVFVGLTLFGPCQWIVFLDHLIVFSAPDCMLVLSSLVFSCFVIPLGLLVFVLFVLVLFGLFFVGHTLFRPW
jgi:hypothetical protein